jgi:hypothetical protein
MADCRQALPAGQLAAGDAGLQKRTSPLPLQELLQVMSL